MTKLNLKNFTCCLFFLLISQEMIYGGNKDRAGQAGATELLVNPWARSSGWWGVNSSAIKGVESMRFNAAGLAFTKKTEAVVALTQWWENPFSKSAINPDISIKAFGLSQRVSESGVLGLSLMSVDFGDIPITTVDLPDGGLGTFSPQFINLGVGYGKEFSESIYCGALVRIVSESIADVKSQGVCFDAGVQYVGGAQKNVKLGLSLRNVGPSMRYNGDGLSFRGIVPETDLQLTVQQRSEEFELPSLLNIGGAYEMKLMEDHFLTFAMNFTSNSFTQDLIGGGLEYKFKSYLSLRGGYNFEKSILSDSDVETAYSGPAAGFTFEVPFGDGGTVLGMDYSWRAAKPFSGTHSIGVHLNL